MERANPGAPSPSAWGSPRRWWRPRWPCVDDRTLEVLLPDPDDPPPGPTGRATLWVADGDTWRRVSP